ncbi:hypothetical protein VPH5P1C_0053 [Vibrio phage 5P1c]
MICLHLYDIIVFLTFRCCRHTYALYSSILSK